MSRISLRVRYELPILAVLALAMAPTSAAQVVNYPNFSSVAGLTLNGNAAQASSVLRLTPSVLNQAGSAFLTSSIKLRADASFCTQFAFQMSDPGGAVEDDGTGADGIVFAIQTDGNTALGGIGERIGYFGATANPITTGVGVEFDSWKNVSRADVDGNHVAIDINGNSPSLVSTAADAVKTAFSGDRLNDGDIYYAWVDYNGVTNRLEVYLAQSAVRPSSFILTHVIDLAPGLGGANVFPGFTSGTASAFNNHDMLSWQLTNESCVQVDLKPGSNPNCVNPKAGGVVSVAILQTALFDPATLIQNTIKFGGADALRCSFEDADADGDVDLTCRFNSKDVTWPGEGSNCGIVALTADTTAGTEVTAYAVACLAGETNCNASTPVGSEYIEVQ